MTHVDAKDRARRTWGSSPTGWASAREFAPGTREFFEKALEFRSEYEQPWLPRLVPFHAMRGKRVLEVGFGPGYDALAFMRNGAVYSGVDLTPENVVRTRQHLAFYGLSPDVVEGDAENLPYADATFDVAYSNGVLHHVPDIERAFREVARVVRPGGDFYVILYHKNSLVYRVRAPLVALLRGIPPSDRLKHMEANAAGETPIVNVYSRGEVKRLLRANGFEPMALSVRKLVAEDLPIPPGITRPFRRLLYPVLYPFSLAFGWYVIAHARRTSGRALDGENAPMPARSSDKSAASAAPN